MDVKKILLAVLILSVGLLFAACDQEEVDKSDLSDVLSAETLEEEKEMQTEPLTLGDTFLFDGLEITIGAVLGWTIVDNQFSDLDGSDAFYLLITLTNLTASPRGLDRFYFSVFGAEGMRLEDVSPFFERDFAWADDILPDESLSSFLYVLYDSDGGYLIEFSDWMHDSISVIFEVRK